jgi:hypothetical protein
MVVGWWEIEHVLASHLPEGTVEYDCPLARMQVGGWGLISRLPRPAVRRAGRPWPEV